MGMKEFIGNLNPFGKEKITSEKVKALVVGGSKKIYILDVKAIDNHFSIGGEQNRTTYIIEPEAIYFYDKKPILFYIAGISSPLRFDSFNKVEFALKSKELSAFMDSKAVEKLLTANKDDTLGWEKYIPYATLIGVVVILLQLAGVIHIGG